MKLRHLLFFTFSGIALLPVISLAAWVYGQALDRELNDVKDRHLVIAKNLGQALQRYTVDLRNGFDLVADAAATGHHMPALTQFLSQMNVSHLCVADIETREVLTEIGPKAQPCPEYIPERRFSEFKSLAKRGQVVFSPVRPNPQGLPTIYLLKRYETRLVVGAVSTDYIVEQGKTVAFGDKGHAAIVDQAGNLIFHPLPEWRRQMKNIAKLTPVQKMISGETGVVKFYSPALKADMIAGFTSIPDVGWGVMVPQPFAELRTAAESVQQIAIAISLAGIMLAAGISWFLAGRLTWPISAVVDVTRRMADGALSARVEANGGFGTREVNELGMAVNNMAAEIEKSNVALLASVKEAEEANQVKSDFVASMSHELRTPLNSILGYAQIIKMDSEAGTPENLSDLSSRILRSGEYLQRLIEDVLDFAKLDAGDLEIAIETLDMRDVLDDCVGFVSKEAAMRGVELIPPTETACRFEVRADRTRFRQCITNVLSNAIKYNNDGGSVRVEIAKAEDRRIHVSVADDGFGIEECKQHELFEPFARLGFENSEIEGTGIGLSYTKQLMEKMGGTIDFESQHGVGSTFRLTIPGEPV